MKMNYQLKSKPKKNVAFGRAWKITLVFCFLVFIFSRISPTLFYKIIEPVSRPLMSIREAFSEGFENRFSFILSKKNIIDENNTLKEKLAEASLSLLNMQVLESENQFLKGIREEGNLMLARIISRPNISPYDTLIVDTGGKQITVGARVFGNKVLLGEVVEVYGYTAKVALFSGSGVETNVEVVPSGITLVLFGQGGGNFRATVPKDFPVETGNVTIVPSYTSSIIAKVVSVDETEADSFKTLYLSYPVNIFEIPWVGISQ